MLALKYSLILFTSIILTTTLRSFAFKINLTDKPDYRKIHKGHIPLVGGISIFLLIFISSLINEYDNYINLIINLSFFIFLLGIIDDKFLISPFIKLFFLMTIALILISFDFKILIFFTELNKINLLLLSISPLITVLAIVAMTNAFNFIDGIDGLCSGIFLITISSLYLLLSLEGYNFKELEIINVLFFIVLGFFLVNINIFKLGKAFLGDSGSLILGFLVATLFIYYTSFSEIKIKPTSVLWCSSLIIFDFFAVFIKRISKGLNPFKPDNSHVHHLLLSKGISQIKILFILLISSMTINITGILIDHYLIEIHSILSFVIFFILYYLFLKKFF